MSGKSTGRNLPLFAQPLNGSKFPTPLTTNNPNAGSWSRPLAWSVAVMMCGALLALARPDKAQNSPTARNANSGSSATTRNANLTNSTPAVNPLLNSREESRRSIDFYTQAVRGNMFSAPQPPAPPAAKVEITVVKPAPHVEVPVVPINPFAEWSYTGTIKSDNQITAVIENTRTKEGQFLKAGDTFMGEQITSITDQEVVLKAGKAPQHSLAKSDNITVTPLDRSAIPTNAQGQAQQGGQQGNAAAMAAIQAMQAMQMSGMMNNMQGGRQRGGFGGAGGQMFSLPNGRQLNQQQFQRRSQGLNQSFNGG